MVDFSPHSCKIAAKRVADMVAKGEFDNFATLSNGDIETITYGQIVHVTMVDGAIVSLRVIDQNGRHWFPEYKDAN